MHASDYTQTAELFKVLMHPERLAILHMLREGERCVCDIEDALHQRQAYVSQQLSVLRSAGLVTSRREGWRVIYRLAVPEIMSLVTLAQAVSNNPRRRTTISTHEFSAQP